MSTENNARFKELGPGMLSEMIADRIEILYDPTTQVPMVIFHSRPYLHTPNSFVPIGGEDARKPLQIDLSTRFTDMPCVGGVDPVSGLDLSNLSIAGAMIIMKMAHDMYFNQDAQAQAAFNAQPSS